MPIRDHSRIARCRRCTLNNRPHPSGNLREALASPGTPLRHKDQLQDACNEAHRLLLVEMALLASLPCATLARSQLVAGALAAGFFCHLQKDATRSARFVNTRAQVLPVAFVLSWSRS